MGISRRSFIKGTAAFGALASFPTIIPSSVLGRNGITPPSDRVNIGLIGCGNRSGAAKDYKEYEKSQVVAVCDPIRERRLIRKKEYDNCAFISNNFFSLKYSISVEWSLNTQYIIATTCGIKMAFR